LNDIADASVDEVEQDVDAALGGHLDLDGALPNRADRFADKVDVDLRGIPVRDVNAVSAVFARTHSLSSLNKVSTFFSAAMRIMMSSFSTLT
jgi:hypothetical protein